MLQDVLALLFLVSFLFYLLFDLFSFLLLFASSLGSTALFVVAASHRRMALILLLFLGFFTSSLAWHLPLDLLGRPGRQPEYGEGRDTQSWPHVV